MLFRAPRHGDLESYARELWDADDVEDVEGLLPWSAEERRELARAILELDHRLDGEGFEDEEDESITLSTESYPGVDYDVTARSILVDVDAIGRDPKAEDALLAYTFEPLDRLAHRTGLLVWSHELQRLIDPMRDRGEIVALVVAGREAAAAARREKRIIVAGIVAAGLVLGSWWLVGDP